MKTGSLQVSQVRKNAQNYETTVSDVIGKSLTLSQEEVLELFNNVAAKRQRFQVLKSKLKNGEFSLSEHSDSSVLYKELKEDIEKLETKLVRSLMDLVYSIAHSYERSRTNHGMKNVDFQELVEYGLEGLYAAIRKFKLGSKYYVSFTSRYINTAIMHGLRQDSSSAGIMTDANIKTFKRIRKELEKQCKGRYISQDSYECYSLFKDIAVREGIDEESASAYYEMNFCLRNANRSEDGLRNYARNIITTKFDVSCCDSSFDIICLQETVELMKSIVKDPINIDIVYRHTALEQSFETIGKVYGFSRAAAKKRFDKAQKLLQESKAYRDNYEGYPDVSSDATTNYDSYAEDSSEFTSYYNRCTDNSAEKTAFFNSYKGKIPFKDLFFIA